MFGLFKKMMIAALPLMLVSACGDDGNKIIPGATTGEQVVVTGALAEDTTWTSDNVYLLQGKVSVEDGVTLTIQPGTRIEGSKTPVGWLQVKRGGTLMAVGEATSPIVFTSSVTDSPQRGDWGGVVLLGKASNNVGTDAELEGNGGTHGGSDDADSSGELKYVRIEFAGHEISPDNELNALTLGSVGSGTKISYVQTHFGLDDAFEWFGGTANATYLVASGTDDDCYDTDEGFRGTLQFVVCMMAPGFGDNGIEASNTGGSDLDVTPRANPQFANFTFIGRQEYESGAGNGIRAKERTALLATNGIVMNFSEGGLDIDDAADADGGNPDDSTIEVDNVVFFGNKAANNDSTDQFTTDDDEVDEFVYATTDTRNNTFADPELNSIKFDSPNLLPASGSEALDADNCPDPAGLNSDFESAAYCGAFKDSDWMSGWTRFSVVEDPTVGAIAVNDDIDSNTTWTADNTYLLVGRVTVKNGATLTIEPGTTILGSKSPIGWLQVERGGKLKAEGTKSEPIVFTSSQPEGERQRGDWGGLVLLGKAANNVGTDAELEGNGGTHGGSTNGDNSGSLKYVRVEFAGWELSPDNELNGITLGSVGNGTTFEHVQVHMGLDDGIEWFGGVADGKYLVVSGTDDDCFDTDEGYSGRVQYAVCVHASDTGNSGIEAANTGGDDLDVTPRATPQFANFTFVGKAQFTGGSSEAGLRYKEGSAGVVINGVVVNFEAGGLDLDDMVDGENTDDSSTVELSDIIFYGNLSEDAATLNANIANDADNTDEQDFAANDSTNLFADDPDLPNVTLGSSLNLVPPANSPARDGSCGTDASVFDSFFDVADYCGAFDDSNWMSGWTNFSTN